MKEIQECTIQAGQEDWDQKFENTITDRQNGKNNKKLQDRSCA